MGGARGNSKFVRSRASACRSRPKPPPQPPHALGTRLELGPRLGCVHSPLTPDTQAAGDQGAGARLTQRVAQGGNVCPSFCRAPLVPRMRMEVRVLAWAGGAPLGFSNSQL